MFGRIVAVGILLAGGTSAGVGWSQETASYSAGVPVITVAPVDVKIGTKVLVRVEANVVVQVEQVSGSWLLVTSQGKNGWIPQTSVIPVAKEQVDRLLALRAAEWEKYQALPANTASARALPIVERLVRIQRSVLLLCEHLFAPDDKDLKQETEVFQALLGKLEELYREAGREGDADTVSREIRSLERKLAADVLPGATGRPGQASFGRGDVVIAHGGSAVKAGAKVLVEVPVGALLRVDAVKQDWLQVTYEGKTGWVRAGEVSLPVAADLDRLSQERETRLEECGAALKAERMEQALRAIERAVYLQRVVVATVLREFPNNHQYVSKAREELFYSLQLQFAVLVRLGRDREAEEIRRELINLERLLPPQDKPSSGTPRSRPSSWLA